MGDRGGHVDRAGGGAALRIEQSDVAGPGRNAGDRAIAANGINAAAIIGGDFAGVAAGAERGHGEQGGETKLHVGAILDAVGAGPRS